MNAVEPGKNNKKHLPSLKLTYPLKIDHPKRKYYIPTIHFQGLLLLVSGMMVDLLDPQHVGR